MGWTDNTKTVTTTGASGMLNQPNFLAKLNPSKTLLNPQPRPKGDIKSTLEAARQRRLAMEQRNSKEVEQVVIVMMVVAVVIMMVMVDDVAKIDESDQ